MVVNPIGLLQELCMSRRWPPPAYETEFEEGLPHERQFTISCVVFKHKETGLYNGYFFFFFFKHLLFNAFYSLHLSI